MSQKHISPPPDSDVLRRHVEPGLQDFCQSGLMDCCLMSCGAMQQVRAELLFRPGYVAYLQSVSKTYEAPCIAEQLFSPLHELGEKKFLLRVV
jgi:hypothetical protein